MIASPEAYTHAARSLNEKFAEFLGIDEDKGPALEEDCLLWTALDDQTLCDGDWAEVLPELAGPTSGYDAHSNRAFGAPKEIEVLRGKVRESVTSALSLEGQGNGGGRLKIDDVESGPVGLRLQAAAVANFLFVADAEAFCDGRVAAIVPGDARRLERTKVPAW
ncbi:hypothetical protein F4679DRAFT_581378 [Xylaria curta]|nr:hypothetical protein F4679DRAFT_581378 [Xylaria curta]